MRIWQRTSLIAGILMLQLPVLASGWMDGDNARLMRGKTLYQSGQMDAAVAEFSGAIQANPRLAEAYYWRGIILSTIKQTARAQADFDSAISLDHAVPAFYMARATLYSNEGKQELALADYDAALKLDPYNQEAQTNRNFTASQLGKSPNIASATTASSAANSSNSSNSLSGGTASSATSTDVLKPTYGNSPTDRAIEKALLKQSGQSVKKLHDDNEAEHKKYLAEKLAAEKEVSARLQREQQENQKLARELEEMKRKNQLAAAAASAPPRSSKRTVIATTSPATKIDTKPGTQVAPIAVATQTPIQEMASLQTAATNVSSANRPIKDKWALIVGISKFKDSDLNLRYPSKDAKDFYTYLTTSGNFAPDHVKLLTDKQASRQNILALLGDKWLPHVANPDDLVVIYISSHGSSSDMDNDGVNYLLAYDSDKDNLYSTGLPMQDLSRMIKARVHSDRVVMILDACHSGAATAESKGLSRGANVNAEAIAQGTGQLVISSSKPNEVSWESNQQPNSVFTKYLMEGLQQKGQKTSLEDAFQYMKEKVEAEVLRDRGVMQTPVLSSKWQGSGLLMGVPPVSPRPGLNNVSLIGLDDQSAQSAQPADSAATKVAPPPAKPTATPTMRAPVAAGVASAKPPVKSKAKPAVGKSSSAPSSVHSSVPSPADLKKLMLKEMPQ